MILSDIKNTIIINKRNNYMEIEQWKNEAKPHLHEKLVDTLASDIASLVGLQLHFRMMYGVDLVVDVQPAKIHEHNF